MDKNLTCYHVVGCNLISGQYKTVAIFHDYNCLNGYMDRKEYEGAVGDYIKSITYCDGYESRSKIGLVIIDYID